MISYDNDKHWCINAIYLRKKGNDILMIYICKLFILVEIAFTVYESSWLVVILDDVLG